MTTIGAISGLLINNEYMDIISNNIANASTVGYKSRQPIFFDIFSRSIYSNNTYGSGVGISNVIENFNNGMLVETGRDLDLGITNNGFFNLLDSQGHIHYTRNGQFLIDKNRNIVNMQGMYLAGKNIINNSSNLEPINLQHAHILKAKPTSLIKLSAVLNNNIKPVPDTENPDHNLSKSENYVSNITIYNKDEKPEQITISFNKIDKNTWNVYIQSNNATKNYEENNFNLKFNSHGELISNKSFKIQSKNSEHDSIYLDLTGTIEQSDADNSFEESFQDGYPQGSLKTFDILPNGEIIGKYSNQQTLPIGQILLSTFMNPEKLQPESGNMWSATEESGNGNIGIAGNANLGILTPRALETSNVDLNKELINMIIAQRNYQSNAQSFKTEDKIISTLINLR